MKRLWKRLRDEDRGQSISEYALLLVLIGLLAASAVSAFGGAVHSTYSTVYAAITNPAFAGATASDSASNAGGSPASSSSSSSSDDSGSDSSSGNSSGNGNGNGNGNSSGHGLALGHNK
jgi:Flp pilus assembly pilin Flp